MRPESGARMKRHANDFDPIWRRITVPFRAHRLELPNPGLKFLAEIRSPSSTSNPAGRVFFHQTRNGVAPCEGRDLHGSQASCEPTSTNSKFSLLPYQPFDLPNKQLFQPSLMFLQRLVYGLAYNGDVVVFDLLVLRHVD